MAAPANRSASKNRPRSAMSASYRTPGSLRSKRSRSRTPKRSLSSSDTETSSDEGGVRVPDLNERLACLRPSRELLEYYRKKIADYDAEHDIVVGKLDEYKKTYEEQHHVYCELREREEEISELQKALSDMQVYLFQEREHVLRLYAENDRLKIRELEDRKKIQHLLALNGAADNEVTYFMKEPPSKATIPQRTPKTFLDEDQPRRGRPAQQPLPLSPDRQARYARDNETLRLQIQSLQSQLEEQTKLAKEHIETLEADRRVKIEEYDAKRERDEEKMKVLTVKLHKTQDLLYDSTKDFLELRHEGRTNEHHWMAEKDTMLQELDVCKQQLNITRDKVLDVDETLNYHTQQKYRGDIKSLTHELKQSQKMADMYREQIIQLEDELGMVKEEGDVSRDIFKDRSDKMTKRLDMMNSRYKELEKRRGLEVEGFRTDIKNLRTKLREVEKHLYKVTAGVGEPLPGERPDDIDIRILRNVRKTAGRSKEIAGSLKLLKAKMYSIENDLRHL